MSKKLHETGSFEELTDPIIVDSRNGEEVLEIRSVTEHTGRLLRDRGDLHSDEVLRRRDRNDEVVRSGEQTYFGEHLLTRRRIEPEEIEPTQFDVRMKEVRERRDVVQHAKPVGLNPSKNLFATAIFGGNVEVMGRACEPISIHCDPADHGPSGSSTERA